MPFSISTQSYLGLRPKTAGIFVLGSEPDWSVIPSKGMYQDISKKEFTEKVIQQAGQDAQTGNYYSRKARQLEAAYLSPISPDRKALYAKCKRAIVLAKKGKTLIPDASRTLIDYLDKTTSQFGLTKTIYLSSGECILADDYGQIKAIRPGNGKTSLLYRWSDGEFSCEYTPDELERAFEFRNMYMTAYDRARTRLELAQNNGEPPPDGKALNILA